MIQNQCSCQYINLILKMQSKKLLLAFDMRVQKRMLKLKVYEDDCLQDLITRFSKAAHLNDCFHDIIKVKLENQFKNFILKKNCSQKIRSKIQGFLEQSKIVIIGISETEVYQPVLTQTPFKMLEETFNHNKISPVKQQQCRNRVSPIVSKYSAKEIYVEQEEQKPRLEQKKWLPAQRELYSYQSQALMTKNLHRYNCKLKNQLPTVEEYQTFRQDPINKYSYNSTQKARPSSTSNYEAYKMEKSQKRSLERRHESKESLKKLYNQQNLIPSQVKPIKSMYDNILNAKFGNYTETRGVSGGFKQIKKFNYLDVAKI